jgi:cell wall-associated NlpC family hydrolase
MRTNGSAWWASYVGLPYSEAHCWGLVRRVYMNRVGLSLPTYGEIDARDLVRVARTMRDDADTGPWQAVTVPQALDVVLLSGRARVAHVGVMVDAVRFLHTEQSTGCVVAQVTNPAVAGRVMGYRRHYSMMLSS